MNNKEIEVKLLGIDIDDMRITLAGLKATFVSDIFQKIYTYDLFPISSSFIGILDVLEKEISPKETTLALQRLVALLHDLSDLLNKEELEKIFILTGYPHFSDFIDSLSGPSIPSVLWEPSFREIIARYHTNPNKWVRLRESNGKVTIALKQIYDRKVIDGVRQHSIDSVKEIETQVSSLEKGKMLLEELGYYHKNYQEKRRISYKLHDNISIDIDSWPHIPAYLEIEAGDKEEVYRVVKLLGFKEEDAKVLNADDVFQFYGIDMYSFKELKFE